MNVRDSAAGLPEPVRQRISAEPEVAACLARGMELHEVLSSPEWAAAWAFGADPLRKAVLRHILLRYGAAAFEEEKGEADAILHGRWTGAEWRVAVAGLRLSGILFAIRKTWGDRLYYVPADMVPVWQRVLLPTGAVPLNERESREVETAAAPFRLPLPLELLSPWASVRRTDVPLTAKGGVAKPAGVRLAAAMRLTPEELEPLGLAYPLREQLPSTAALALDLGLCTGVLRRRGQAIAVHRAGAETWMARSVPEADAELHRFVMLRYAAPEPARHLAACAVSSCQAFAWYRDRDIVGIGLDPAAWDVWLNLLVSFGWAERGTCRGHAVFRLLADLGAERDRSGPEEAGPEESGPAERTERFIVQPDGEVYVPPGVGLAERWKLEAVCERKTADRVFVYRLTPSAIRRAYSLGWREKELRDFLERGSEAPLPAPVHEALRDWFRVLGKVRIAEAVLLRTEDAETAERLLGDEQTAGWLAERVGDRDFIVDRANVKALAARLEKIGFPPAPERFEGDEPEPDGEEATATNDPGWVYAGSLPALCRQDGTLETAGRLFPGLTDVPPVWLRKPGSYHATTRRELVRRAIDWRAALQVGEEGGARLFVPDSLETAGEQWLVRGRWRSGSAPGGSSEPEEPAALPADRCCPLRIVLPDLELFTASGGLGG